MTPHKGLPEADMKRLRDNLLWALAYMAGAYLGLNLAVPPGGISPIWPASGVALAGLLIRGAGILPGLLLGACAMQLFSFYDGSSPLTILHSLILGLTISTGSILQAWTGYRLARRYLPHPLSLIRTREVLRFTLLPGALACTIAPSVGALSLYLAGAFGVAQVPEVWATWWIGDGLGVIITTPLILAFLGSPATYWRTRRLALGISLGLTLLLVGAFFHFLVEQADRRIGLEFSHASERALEQIEARLRQVASELEYLGPDPSARRIPPDLREWVDRLILLPGQDRATQVLYDSAASACPDLGQLSVSATAALQLRWLPACETLFILTRIPGRAARLGAGIPRASLASLLDAKLPAGSGLRLGLSRAGGAGQVVLLRRRGAPYRHAKRVSFKPRARVTRRFAGYTLALEARAPARYVTQAYGWNLWAMLVSGFAFSALLSTGLLILTGQKSLISEQVEARTRALAEEVEEHRRTTRILALQNEILEMVARNSPLQDTLDHLCRRFEALSRPGTFASVMLADHRHGVLHLASGPSIPGEVAQALMSVPIADNEGSCGSAVFRGEQVLACDIGQAIEWRKYRDFALGNGLHACWSTPFFDASGKALGSFALTQTESRAPTDADRTHMQVGASLCALVVEQARRVELLNKLHLAVAQNPNAIAITDTEGRVEYVNARFMELTGHDGEEVMDRILPDLLGVDLPAGEREKLWQGLLEGQEWRMKTRYQRRNGETYWAQCYAAPVRNEQGKVTHVVAIHEDVTELHEASERIAHQATHDQLTGLINRHAFKQRLEELHTRAIQQQETHVLCVIDMDRFKAVNDACGHVGGDELLRQFSQLMRQSVRRHDTLARLGGDEFAILFEHCDQAQALRNLETLQKAVAEHRFIWLEQAFHIGFSAGLVEINRLSPGAHELLQEADAACYQAKLGGRNQAQAYRRDQQEPHRQSREMQLVTGLRDALEEGRLQLYRQRIQALGPGHRDNMEILLRLRQADGLLATPAEFLPAAERFGLARSVDNWVVEHSLRHLAGHPDRWTDLGHCAINLSGLSLSNDFAHQIIDWLEHYGIDGHRICFEITETAAIANLSQAQHFIHTLREHGVLFALDDFGSGLSSFGYLKALPVDVLKIDGQFVRDMLDDPDDFAIVRSIAELGQALQRPTVAEFVENEEILDALRRFGVPYAQGYAIARPEPLA